MWTPSIVVQESGEMVTVLVHQRPYMRYHRADALAHRLALVQLHALGVASQDALAQAFRVHVKSVYNALTTFHAEGSRGLCPERRGPRGAWKVTPTRRGKILAVAFQHGTVNVEAIATTLKEDWHEDLSTFSISEVLQENGLSANVPQAPALIPSTPVWAPGGQLTLSWGSASSPTDRPVPPTSEAPTGTGTPTRQPLAPLSQAERLYLAQLREGHFNAMVGGLLYAPFLDRARYLETVAMVVDEGEEDYTREHMALTLFYVQAFRVRSIEAVKMLAPEELGLLIGRLTSPAVRTLRRFLNTVAQYARTEAVVDAVTTTWLRLGCVQSTPLYVDGHFMPYYGDKVIAKGYWPQRQMGLKGSELFMAVDAQFRPVVWSLTSCQTDLTEAIPALLQKLQRLAAEANVPAKGLTVIFDREGYSGSLFRTLDDLKVTFITWAKYADRWVEEIPTESFTHEMTLDYDVRPSEPVRYFETTRPMSKYGPIRTIMIDSPHRQKRAAIFTNDPTRAPAAIIQLIARRWGEENWFNVMKHSLRLDYVPGHAAEELIKQPSVENPDRASLSRTKAMLTERLRALQIRLGQQVVQATTADRWAALQTASLSVRAEITEVETSLRQVIETQTALPATVSFSEAHGHPLSELEYHRKRLVDTTKIFVYLMEKQLCEVLAPGYAGRKRDLWPTLHTIVCRGGWVRLDGEIVRVRLRRFWHPSVERAAHTLCERLNQMAPHTLDQFAFPIHYEVE